MDPSNLQLQESMYGHEDMEDQTLQSYPIKSHRNKLRKSDSDDFKGNDDKSWSIYAKCVCFQ